MSNTHSLYQEIALKIVEELNTRGFTVEDNTQAEGLSESIVDIIEHTINGNTNFYEADYFPNLRKISAEEKRRLIKEMLEAED